MGTDARVSMQFVLAVLVHFTLLGVFVWDMIALVSNRPEETVSSMLRSWSLRYPELLLLVGYVICHLFGR